MIETLLILSKVLLAMGIMFFVGTCLVWFRLKKLLKTTNKRNSRKISEINTDALESVYKEYKRVLLIGE